MNLISGKIFKLAFISALALSASSCVTKKKYDDLNSRSAQLSREMADCDQNLKMALEVQKNQEKELTTLTEVNRRLVSDSTETGILLRKTLRLHTDLNTTYDKLISNHEKLMSNSASESSRLALDLARRETQLKALDESLKTSKGQVDKLSGDLKAREERLQELERILVEKEKAVNSLRSKVSNALLGFKDKDLTVNVKNGKVYVSLAEQLLFGSGSTKVDPKGQEALQKLAKVLKDQSEVNVLVEGHTDDVPVAKISGIQDNWDLSVMRATEITRILTKSGLATTQITPSGRADTAPLEVGKTPEIRQRNRRTEIILTPKLDELFQLLEKN